MSYILMFGTSLFEALVWLRICRIFLTDKYGKTTYVVSLVTLALLFSIKSLVVKYEYELIPDNNIIFLLINFAVISLLTFKIFNGKISQKIACLVIYIIGSAVFDLLIMTIFVYTYSKITFLDFVDLTPTAIIVSLMGKSVLFFMLTFIRNKNINIEVNNRYKNSVILLIIVDFILFLNLFYILTASDIIITKDGIISFLVISILSISGLSLVILKQVYNSSYHLFENQLKIREMEIKLEQDKKMESLTKKCTSLRHDMNNHVGVMKGFCETNQIELLKEYMNDIYNEIQCASEYIVTEDKTLTLILNNKKALADSKDIYLDIYISNGKVPLNTIEISSLFGNVLDNAIEAAESVLENKYIKLKIVNQEKCCYIECENAYLKEPLVKKNKFISFKTEGMHGIGTKNIKDIVEKHKGKMEISYADNIFKISIEIPTI